MGRKYKIDELLAELSAEERAAYEALLRQPATTIDDLLQWFAARNLRVSRGAAHNHRKSFSEILDGVRRSAELSRAFVQVARESGTETLADANLARFQQLLTEKLMSLDADETLDATELRQLAAAMNNAALGAQRVAELKRQHEEQKQAAIEAAQQAASAGKGSDAVVAALKRALLGEAA